jgi:hypothetical protein
MITPAQTAKAKDLNGSIGMIAQCRERHGECQRGDRDRATRARDGDAKRRGHVAPVCLLPVSADDEKVVIGPERQEHQPAASGK